MTSWKRGDKNEDKGEKLMKSPDVGDKAKGVVLKTAGEIEQGIDNVKDKVTGKQDTWQGDTTKKASTRSKSTASKSSASKSTSARSSSKTASAKKG